jgi:heme/copper-type cytochrome/quinol oxidase subunit 1
MKLIPIVIFNLILFAITVTILSLNIKSKRYLENQEYEDLKNNIIISTVLSWFLVVVCLGTLYFVYKQIVNVRYPTKNVDICFLAFVVFMMLVWIAISILLSLINKNKLQYDGGNTVKIIEIVSSVILGFQFLVLLLQGFFIYRSKRDVHTQNGTNEINE